MIFLFGDFPFQKGPNLARFCESQQQIVLNVQTNEQNKVAEPAIVHANTFRGRA